MTKKRVLGINTGGTKIRIGEVDISTGKVLKLTRERLENFQKQSDFDSWILEMVREFGKGPFYIGYATAGIVDEENLEVLYASIMRFKTKAPKKLKKFGHFVSMTNDMPAETYAIGTFGDAKNLDVFSLLNLGSGVNGTKAVRDSKKRVIIRDRPELGIREWYPSIEIKFPPNSRTREGFCGSEGYASMARNAYNSIKNNLSDTTLCMTLKRLKESGKSLEVKLNEQCEKKIFSNQKSRNILIKSLNAEDLWNAYKQTPNEEPQKSATETVKLSIAYLIGDFNLIYRPLGTLFGKGNLVDETYLAEEAYKLYLSDLDRFQGTGKEVLNPAKFKITKMKQAGVIGAAVDVAQKYSLKIGAK
jgi:hypothetical protein